MPSLVFIETEIHFVHDIILTIPNALTATATGIAQLYSAAPNSGLVGSMANGSLLEFNCKLICGLISPMVTGWMAQIDGNWLTPFGNVMPFWTTLAAPNITDSSVIDNYNLITFTTRPFFTATDVWTIESQKTTWYTQGAPH